MTGSRMGTSRELHDALTTKTTPVDADEVVVLDSAASYVRKRLTWANLKATIKTYYDTVTSTLTNKDLTSGTNTFPTLNQNTTGSAAKWTTARNVDGQSLDGTANITVVAPGTHAASSKTTPVDADEIPLVDSAASNVLAKLTWANMKAGIKASADVRVKRGLAKTSGGTQQWAVPGVGFVVSNGLALAANVDSYVPFYVDYPITITDWAFEVTTTPASTSNRRIGIYAATTDLQPTGNPIYDSGDQSVANGFTGVKTVGSLSITLQPGLYLTAINQSVALSCRGYSAPIGAVSSASMGTNYVYALAVTRTYAAFTSPGTVWTTASTATVGFAHFTLFKWTE